MNPSVRVASPWDIRRPGRPLPIEQRERSPRPLKKPGRAVVDLPDRSWIGPAGAKQRLDLLMDLVPALARVPAVDHLRPDLAGRLVIRLGDLSEPFQQDARERVLAAVEVGEGVHPLPPLHEQQRLADLRSEEHTSELQSQSNLVCRLLLEKK